MDDEALIALVRKVSLENAVRYGGKAAEGSVMGGIMSGHPELRGQAKALQGIVREQVAQVNALSGEEQQAQLDALGGASRKKEAKKRHPFKPLPRLEEHEKVVMRFAPNPNGPATLGHSRGMVTMAEYKGIVLREGRKAVTVLRFDDTDPQVKPPYPPAYDWLAEDYAWLYEDEPDRVPDLEVRASDRVMEYYKVAEELLRRDAAYVCACTKEEGQRYRKEGRPCPHRERPAAMQLEEWKRMVEGDAPEGGLTLRVKTQVDHRDPALRDWVGLRVVKTPHPMVADRYKVWPMLDFESAVEDHLLGVTHIIRGKDLMDSTRRQRFLYEHMGWSYPETLYWGRVRIDGAGSFSSSGMRKAIEEGRFTGWDDPRLPTLRALRRRGIQARAVRAFWVAMGLSEKDVAASMLNLYAENERLVEPDAPRFFFVHDAVPLRFSLPDDLAPEDGRLMGENPVHPDHPERGARRMEVPVTDATAEVIVERDDLEKARQAGHLRLKGLLNLKVRAGADGQVDAECTGFSPEEHRNTRGPIVQWLPVDPGSSVPAVVLRPEPSDDPQGVRHEGRVEKTVLEATEGSVARFERYGFVRLEHVAPHVQAVFTHE